MIIEAIDYSALSCFICFRLP